MTYPPYGDSPDHPGQSGYGSPGGYGSSGYSSAGYGAGSPLPAPGVAPGRRSARPGPPSNVGWAVASIVCFWPLSFIAMTRALDVYPLWADGRHAEAEAASATAKKLGIVSVALVAALFMLYLLFVVVMVGLASTGF